MIDEWWLSLLIFMTTLQIWASVGHMTCIMTMSSLKSNCQIKIRKSKVIDVSAPYPEGQVISQNSVRGFCDFKITWFFLWFFLWVQWFLVIILCYSGVIFSVISWFRDFFVILWFFVIFVILFMSFVILWFACDFCDFVICLWFSCGFQEGAHTKSKWFTLALPLSISVL